MIIKERDPNHHSETDKFSIAGAEAEKQMAFYLRRAFSSDKDILVFNDLRFRDETGDAAQIDHLVMHREGFIIVESKSVTSSVEINPHGEWTRLWNGSRHGMPSPIQQAKRQIDFLRRALNANREHLLNKALFGLLQKGFINVPFDILIAISDKGTIRRHADVPEVTKADLVPEKIREIVAKRKWDASLTNVKSDAPQYNFTDEEMQRVASFLTEHHCPLVAETGKQPATSVSHHQAQPPAPPPVPASPTQQSTPPPPGTEAGLGICDKCGAQCEILWGKFSYYWKCHACDNNMAIKEYCPKCRGKMKLRKDKKKFFIGCEACGGEKLYCEFE